MISCAMQHIIHRRAGVRFLGGEVGAEAVSVHSRVVASPGKQQREAANQSSASW